MSLRKSQSEHWGGKSKEIVESYWTSSKAVERSKWFAEQLKKYEFDSVFEVGVFSGRNLHYIKEVFPDVLIAGLDINARAIRYAREKLAGKLRYDADLYRLDLHSMLDVRKHDSTPFDIVFTSGVAIHVPTENIVQMADKMLKLSNKYVMHLEECGNGEVIKGPKHMKPKKRESDQVQWAPDLVGLYRQQGFTPTVIPLPETTQTNGAKELIIIDKEQK